MRKWILLASVFLLSSCGTTQTVSEPTTTAVESAQEQVDVAWGDMASCKVETAVSVDQEAALLLAESWPSETSLDNEHIVDVTEVWLDAIDRAQESIDLSHFYAVRAVNTRLEDVIFALHEAGKRGVKIRFILDKTMHKDDNVYLPQELQSIENLELRFIDYATITGGVQHAKYFVIDREIAYLGSQNFDWRSLEEIAEMGVRIQQKDLVDAMAQVFELDWQLAADPYAKIDRPAVCAKAHKMQYKGDDVVVHSAFSPKELMPCDDLWDLPQILALISEASQSIDIQLLNYATQNYDKTTFFEIDEALIAAAERGVKVRLLVSDWSQREKYIRDLQRLEQIDNIETKMATISEKSTGFVPYSRTIHSKFMVVDKQNAWIGTSNWSGDYFYQSRNVGIVVEGASFARDLDKSFEHYWNSDYAHAVDPNRSYEAKKHY